MAFVEIGPRGLDMLTRDFSIIAQVVEALPTRAVYRSLDLDTQTYVGSFLYDQAGIVRAGFITEYTQTWGDGVFDYRVSGIHIPFTDYVFFAERDDLQGLYRHGLTFNDTIVGGAGHDRVFGHTGDDIILGNNGDDVLFGDEGNDDINGNLGGDIVIGGSGPDFVRGGQDNDTVFGGDGDDWHVNGNLGFDLVYGGTGHDAVYGGPENDLVYGEAGNDTLSGDRHNDTLTGGADTDLFVFRGDGGWDIVTDFSRAQGDKIAVQANVNGTGIASTADLLARLSADPGGSALLDLGDGHKVGILGVSPTTLTASDFWII